MDHTQVSSGCWAVKKGEECTWRGMQKPPCPGRNVFSVPTDQSSPVKLEHRGEGEEAGLESQQGEPQSLRAEVRNYNFILPSMGSH